eukprot:CAMPEP_0178937826 /NCGR_PEP_ID=MMETSP0786-20121207/25984_1 /TAXON_ID=186022 /ORGANISM="Thalassionema frauenfeldii, Strain CCMP 1798" /LENGTH=1197 /DNA_ID=CAMNT_0020616463 /DNA_START=228 /DNA_END=3821 /DNA_ORIENTATION=+
MSDVINDNDNDIEKGNYDYYLLEHEHTGCWSRFCHEFCQHPFTLLEVNGYVIDIQQTFAAKPSWFVVPLKLMITGVAMDVFVRDLINYTGVKSFWLAYYNNWTTVLTLIYLFLSLFNSLYCEGTKNQPTAYENRAPCLICVTWVFWVLSLSYQFINFFGYWSLVYYSWEEGSEIMAVSYFTVMKAFGIFVLLTVEGQVLNRIPMRWAHLTIAELGFLGYIFWSLIHHASGMGNPDTGDIGIYWFLNWSDETLNETSAAVAVTMLIVLPAIWFVFYVLSWPFRRYMPVDEEKAHGAADMEDLPEIVICNLEAGSLMAHFDGNDFPPRVKELAEDSPLHAYGVVPGMVVDTLELADGTTYYELTVEELVQHLTESSYQDGRIVTFLNPHVRALTPTPAIPDHGARPPSSLPATAADPIEVTLPPGKVGIVLADEPPVVSRISDESPLVGTGVTVGMVVDTLTLLFDEEDEEEDAVTHYELEASELTQLLKDHADSEGRVLRFLPAGMDVTKKPPVAKALSLALPAGSIGLVFSKASPPEIKQIKETSPLLELYPDFFVPGMIVDTLTLEDGTVHYEMTGKECTSLLKDHKDSDGRIMRVILPGMDLTPTPTSNSSSSSSIMPDEVLACVFPGPLGFRMEGEPPMVQSMEEDSVLHDFGVVVGMVVDTIEVEGGETHYELTTEQATELLQQYENADERILRFINPDVHDVTPTPTPQEEEEEEVEEIVKEMPPELYCAVPSGDLGVIFDEQEQPPKVAALEDDSCLKDFGVVPGMVVDTIELEDSTKHYELTTNELTDLLLQHEYSEGRMICFINPDLVDITLKPVIEEEEEEMPLECEAHLPAGTIGCGFNHNPVAITEMDEDSPLHDDNVVVGMLVDTVMLGDGTVHYELELDAFLTLLHDHKDEEGRVVRFIHPDHYDELKTPKPPYQGPDEVTCTVPAGSLGVSFNGAPPFVTKLSDESPLHDEGVVVGMKVDTVQIDGVTHYEMDHLEVSALLKEHAESEEERVIRFVAPHYVNIPPPLPKDICLTDDPESLEVELPPTQKLGLTFAGTHPICIKTVRPGSELSSEQPHKLEGYGINRIYVPGYDPEHHCQLNNIKQVMVLLMKTKHIEGRLLCLKKPELYPDGFDKTDDYAPEGSEPSSSSVHWTDEELEIKTNLMEMGFEESAIVHCMQNYKDAGRPIDMDDIMAGIIEEGAG